MSWLATAGVRRGVRARGDRGSGTVLMLAVSAVLVLLLGGGMLLVSATHASTRARSAADLAALAAADVLLNPRGSATPCAIAAALAASNSAQLLSCQASATDVTVTVAVRASVRRLGMATARSRAGLDATREGVAG